MKGNIFSFPLLRGLTLLASLGLLIIGCTQYDYTSPSPGLIEIRLRSISNNIPFSPLNNFVLKVSGVGAIRSDGTVVTINEDIKATSRTTNIYNTLDSLALDSAIVMGQGYAPPGDYIGVALLITPGQQVIENGYQVIPVVTSEGFNSGLAFRGSYHVTESQFTRITLTVNIDSTLIQGYVYYHYRPYYFISSIR